MAARSEELAIRTETGAVYDSVNRLADAIRQLSDRHNVVSPGGALGGQLPILHVAAISFVFADPEADGYPIPGRPGVRGLGKAKLEAIGAAAGVRWIPDHCGQVDQWDDPHRVKYQSTASVQQLDGTERLIVASKVIDLRAGRDRPVDTWGSDAQEIARQAERAKDRSGRPSPRDPWPEILVARKNIHSLAETKSRLRALRSLGVKTAYTEAEMSRGWAIVRLQFTGRHSDPVVERMVAEKVADRALSAAGILYGGGTRPQLPARSGKVVELPETENDEDSSPPFKAEVLEVEADNDEPVAGGAPADAEVLGERGPDGKWTTVWASSLSLDAIIEKIERTERALAAGRVKRPDEAQSNLAALRAWKAFREASTGCGGHGASEEVPF